MNKKIKVYIASAYTLGDVAVNVKAQIDCADVLIEEGFIPFAPLYSHFQHMVHPRPYSDWVEQDMEWVSACDCLLRLPGESKGADAEVELAEKLGKPVFHSISDMISNRERLARKAACPFKVCPHLEKCKESCSMIDVITKLTHG